jgi:hypothetical protein
MRALPILACLLTFSAAVVRAEDVDVKATLDQRLSELRDYQLKDVCGPVQEGTRTVRLPDVIPGGGKVQIPNIVNRCNPSFGKLKVTSLSYSEIIFDEMRVVKNALPERVEAQTVVSINCSPADQNSQADFEISTTDARSFATTKGITNTLTASTNFSMGGQDAMNFGGTIENSYQVSATTEKRTEQQAGRRINRSIPVVIKEMTAFFSQAKIIQSTDRLHWKARIIMDGGVTENKEEVKNISSILRPIQRTFNLEGYIENVKSNDLAIDYYGRSLTKQDCERLLAQQAPLSYSVNRLIGPNDIFSTQKQ